MKNYIFSNFSGAYLEEEFVKHQKNHKIETIVELGARECRDTILLAERYPNAKVFSFECNPDTIELCKYNLSIVDSSVRERIYFFPFAAGNLNSSNKFYKFIAEGNPGASSFYLRNDGINKQVETNFEIKIVRVDEILENFNIKNVDLVCADIQGYEIEALKGFGKYLNNVKFIITEIPKDKSMYLGAPTKKEMIDFFIENNFEIIELKQENIHEDNILLLNKGIK